MFKKKKRQQNFIAELFRGRGRTFFNEDRQIIIHYYGEKKTQGMRLHMMCLILTSLMYFNAEETILTCHMKERTWPLQEIKTSRILLTI